MSLFDDCVVVGESLGLILYEDLWEGAQLNPVSMLVKLEELMLSEHCVDLTH